METNEEFSPTELLLPIHSFSQRKLYPYQRTSSFILVSLSMILAIKDLIKGCSCDHHDHSNPHHKKKHKNFIKTRGKSRKEKVSTWTLQEPIPDASVGSPPLPKRKNYVNYVKRRTSRILKSQIVHKKNAHELVQRKLKNTHRLIDQDFISEPITRCYLAG